MEIRLLAFASAGDAVGANESTVELPDGSTLADLKALLDRRHPGLAPLWSRLAIAVDGELTGPEAPLASGAEVALLPPVSGGCPDGAPEPRRAAVPAVALLDEAIDIEAVRSAVDDPSRGAVILFLGTVRDHHAGRPVAALEYSAYRPMAEARLRGIAEELAAEKDGTRVAIHHRTGRLLPGEVSVVIAVGSRHREEGYALSRRALERLKAEVPIWKHEHYGDGSSAWREEESLRRSTS